MTPIKLTSDFQLSEQTSLYDMHCSTHLQGMRFGDNFDGWEKVSGSAWHRLARLRVSHH